MTYKKSLTNTLKVEQTFKDALVCAQVYTRIARKQQLIVVQEAYNAYALLVLILAVNIAGIQSCVLRAEKSTIMLYIPYRQTALLPAHERFYTRLPKQIVFSKKRILGYAKKAINIPEKKGSSAEKTNQKTGEIY